MKRSLRNFGNRNTPPNTQKDTPRESRQPQGGGDTVQPNKMLENLDPNTASTLQSVLSQYGNKSEAELLDDLRRFKQSGMMDMQSLYDMANRIAPMLNPQQQQKLSQIIQALSE